MQLLRLFIDSDLGQGLSVTEAGRRLGVGKSTVSRLMATLAAERMLVMDDDTRRYHVGPMAFELGSRFAGATLSSSLAPVVRDLADKAECTAQLGTLQGHHMLYLSVAQGPGRLRVVASPGELRYVHASAMGKAFLAGLDEDEQDSLIGSMVGEDGLLPASAPNTIRDPKALKHELMLTRRRGYSSSNEEAARGVAAFGVQVQGASGFPLALSVAFPTNQFSAADHTQLVDCLQDAAAAIRLKLSARPEATAVKA